MGLAWIRWHGTHTRIECVVRPAGILFDGDVERGARGDEFGSARYSSECRHESAGPFGYAEGRFAGWVQPDAAAERAMVSDDAGEWHVQRGPDGDGRSSLQSELEAAERDANGVAGDGPDGE